MIVLTLASVMVNFKNPFIKINWLKMIPFSKKKKKTCKALIIILSTHRINYKVL